MKDTIYAAVLAAGLGKRMKSKIPKVLHLILGRPMVHFVLDALVPIDLAETYIIVGNQAEDVEKTIGTGFRYVLQSEQKGTGHAVRQLEPYLSETDGVLLVIPGDMPLIETKHLEALLAEQQRSASLAVVLTATVQDPFSLGRIIRGANGSFQGIVEEADATAKQKTIQEVSTSAYAFRLPELFRYLKIIRAINSQGEYYLTDVLSLMMPDGVVSAIAYQDIPQIGVNDKIQLAACAGSLKRRRIDQLRSRGVTIEDENTVSLDWTVQIGEDSLIRPFTLLEGTTSIGRACTVGPFVRLKNENVPDGATVCYQWKQEGRST
jgi:bifunctional UDP-N-acetylglucosamine pyrophosphorylase/glucosamine-1-phosphate N-acetyltransferase